MASYYVQVATGHDNTASYTRFLYDPLVRRIETGILRFSVSGLVGEDGERSCVLEWVPEVPNAARTDAMTKLGLATATLSPITISLPTNKDRSAYQDYNASAVWFEEDDYEGGGGPLRVRVLYLESI